MCRPGDVDRGCALRVGLGPVDIRPSSRVEDEVDLSSQQGVAGRRRDVPAVARQRDHVVVRELLRERVAKLATGARDQDATPASRADRIGVLELHSEATRGSSHGTVCSSGSAGSYSTVTW